MRTDFVTTTVFVGDLSVFVRTDFVAVVVFPSSLSTVVRTQPLSLIDGGDCVCVLLFVVLQKFYM